MFLEVELRRDVAMCTGHLSGLIPHQQIVRRLLQDLMSEKACEEHGFYLAVTSLKNIGNPNLLEDDNGGGWSYRPVTFPVSFTCRTFLPRRGEVLKGVVQRVFRNGVFISCGPIRYAYLSAIKMPGYHYLDRDENLCFRKEDCSKIEVGVVVRFKVLAVRFNERQNKKRNDFYVLATIEGKSFGPISLAGPDEPYM
ncbi:PREDICTED: DNA-directed RNA polymerase subunit 7-like protein [Tarenaya hassleriana]|uniref:DNA-directed RNA polymerase subunit 7-like protein n=1 Tax=Tarenaya hassleriana TaxID=28532 RepID=UPI00053C127B|nr:PREDICTED: DNA-directed RNA polymerase subunit 7-like protein [Tarenaya hassleriana]